VKSLAAFSLVIICVLGGQVFAGDAMAPLTRADCEKTPGWSWSEHANVCEAAANDMATLPKPQPLTRADCDTAGMAWNDRALVCEDKTQSTARAADVKGTNPVASSILITIDKSTQRMTVLVDGMPKYDWPVSTGKRGYSTPSGNFTPLSMNEIWYSKEWDNAPMPHAIFYMKDGHAIHGSYEVRNLGKPASHGCVRISPQNATILYQLVKATGLENTQVVLNGETLGGEGQVASSQKSKARSGQSALRSSRPRNNYYVDSYAQPQRRCGIFRLRWCGASYGPQGASRP
jgi:L,D-transpeptidase-like protein